MNLINTLLLVLFSTLIGGIGVLVYTKNPRNNVNRSFAASTILIAIWLISNQLSNTYQNYLIVLILNRIIFISTSLLSASLLYFSILFPGNKKLNLRNFLILIIPPLAVAALSATGLIVKDITIKSGQSDIQFGSLSILYVIQFLLYILLTLYFLTKKFFVLKGTEKLQVKFIFIGLVSSTIIILVTNLIIPFVTSNFDLTTYGSYSVVLLIVFTSYSILKHKFMDLRFILTEIASGIVLLALIIQLALSKSILAISINGMLLAVVSYGIFLLIKSINQEVERRRQIQKLADDLKEANTHLKELDQLKDDFLSMAAHELNTPIAAIEGYLSMILEENIGGEVNPKVKKYLENMFTSSKRLALLVHDMLNVSRIESGRIHLVYVNTPIEDVINQAIAEIGSKAKERKHTLEFEKPAKKLPGTWFDMTRITEVLINLIGNAIKYTDPGGKIEVSASADDKFITVSVKDNGRGIPADKGKTVFDKFSQVDILKDEVKGTGLGMYIAKKFVELHKGKIWFDSSVGESNHGTTFYFTLPILDKKPFDPHEGEGEVLH